MLAAIFWKFSNFINIVTDYSNAMNELTEECIRNISFSIGLRNEPKMMCVFELGILNSKIIRTIENQKRQVFQCNLNN